jgi:hypothetical protein
MHETIGQQRHHGRVKLAKFLDRPHFFGVGAVEGLHGEITILDSQAVVTAVALNGHPEATDPESVQATLLAGSSVPRWTSHEFDQGVSESELDGTIAAAAERAGIDTAAPFVFVIEGTLTDVRLHVINGACPVHARMKNLALADDQRPFQLEASNLKGTTVGIYARGSVGELTHPATSTHAHLIYEDARTGQRVTGHLERFGLAAGAVLQLPADATP